MSARPGASKPTGARHATGSAAAPSAPPFSPAAAGGLPAFPWPSRQQRGWLAAAAALAALWFVFRTWSGGGSTDSGRLLGMTGQRCGSGGGREAPLAQPLGADVRGWQGGTPLGCVAMSSFYQRWIRGDLRRWEGERVAVTRVWAFFLPCPLPDTLGDQLWTVWQHAAGVWIAANGAAKPSDLSVKAAVSARQSPSALHMVA